MLAAQMVEGELVSIVKPPVGRRAGGVFSSNTPRTFSNPPPYEAKLSNTPRRSRGVFESLAEYGGGFEKVQGVFD